MSFAKIRRVINRLDGAAPHQVLLTLDATTGHNGLTQAQAFTEAVGCTGIFLAKLDGTARGGIVLSIHRELGVPILFIGTGEGLDDLAPFDPVEFVDALVGASRLTPDYQLTVQDIVAWLIALEALSWLGFPVAHLLMGRLADRGWAVARILALLLLAWVTWIGGSVGIVPNSPVGILAALSVFVLGSVWLAHRQRSELRDFFRRRWTVVLTVELTFLAMFAFWALVISEVPAINHTEKPMDFGILSAIVSADSFPPMDSWLAGHGIAYYYGGHYVAAMLTTLTGVPTDMAYNLSIATVAALAATGVLGLVYNLLRFSGSRVSPALVVGLIAAGGVLLLGNLSGALEFAHVRGIGGEGFWGWAGIKGLAAPTGVEGWFPDQFWWWWRGSRVIDTLAETGVSLDYTITEVPFFSFLLGDLHAHVTVLPFLLLVLTLALSMMVSPNPPGLDWIRRQPLGSRSRVPGSWSPGLHERLGLSRLSGNHWHGRVIAMVLLVYPDRRLICLGQQSAGKPVGKVGWPRRIADAGDRRRRRGPVPTVLLVI